MAASTWFHGSAWPPGNQGIMPDGSCHSAMASTVSASCAALTTPATSGSTAVPRCWSDAAGLRA